MDNQTESEPTEPVETPAEGGLAGPPCSVLTANDARIFLEVIGQEINHPPVETSYVMQHQRSDGSWYDSMRHVALAASIEAHRVHASNPHYKSRIVKRVEQAIVLPNAKGLPPVDGNDL